MSPCLSHHPHIRPTAHLTHLQLPASTCTLTRYSLPLVRPALPPCWLLTPSLSSSHSIPLILAALNHQLHSVTGDIGSVGFSSTKPRQLHRRIHHSSSRTFHGHIFASFSSHFSFFSLHFLLFPLCLPSFISIFLFITLPHFDDLDIFTPTFLSQIFSLFSAFPFTLCSSCTHPFLSRLFPSSHRHARHAPHWDASHGDHKGHLPWRNHTEFRSSAASAQDWESRHFSPPSHHHQRSWTFRSHTHLWKPPYHHHHPCPFHKHIPCRAASSHTHPLLPSLPGEQEIVITLTHLPLHHSALSHDSSAPHSAFPWTVSSFSQHSQL